MTNKSAKISRSVIAIYAIAIILYILAFILIPFPKFIASWISFAFSIFSIIVSLIAFKYAFNGKNAMNAIYGFPIFRVGLIYMITQTVAGIIFCIIASFVTIPFWIPLLLSFLLLGVTAILLIVAYNTRDAVVDIEDSSTAKIKKLSVFNIDIAGIIDTCEDIELKVLLQELGDAFKYSSDPVSNESTKSIEAQIEFELSSLKDFVTQNDIENATNKTKQISRLLSERNRICQSNK